MTNFVEQKAYAYVKKNDYPLWKTLDIKEKVGKTVICYQEFFKINGIYHHDNGKRYVELVRDNGDWVGFVNANACAINEEPISDFEILEKEGKVIQKGYPLWQNLQFDLFYDYSDVFFNETMYILGYYTHLSGTVYYSLYDQEHIWQGYVESSVVELIED